MKCLDSQTCVLRVRSYIRVPSAESQLQRLSPQSNNLTLKATLMSTSTPPPLCDDNTDPKHKHTNAIPIPHIVTISFHYIAFEGYT